MDLLLNERDYYQRMIETYAPNRIRYSYVDQWNQAGIVTPITNPYIKDRWDDTDINQRINPA